jgi:cytochrome c biogenesis protein CcmG/thiol:disulfide interchange protein DsbE
LVVVVNFWASWCAPCRDEAPVLERIWREYKDKGAILVGVNVNDVTTKAMAFIEEFNITYPNGPDPYNRISRAYGITGVPETFLIAKDGRLAKHYIGPISDARLRAALEELLQQ